MVFRKESAAVVILIVISAVGFFIWRLQGDSANAARLEAETLKGLTADEIGLILKSEFPADPKAVAAFRESEERRKIFIDGMREHLALASQARRENFAQNDDYRINVEYKKNILLADLYRIKLSEPKKTYVVPEAEIEALWNNSENEKLFERDFDILKKIQTEAAQAQGNPIPNTEFKGQALIDVRNKWANTKILSERAKADDEFMSRTDVGLRLKIIEAGILSNDYLRANWAKKIRATGEEIKNYLAAHPEYSVEKKLQKAEMILAKVKAGEDFAKLAAQHSEDRATKEKGGLYENIGSNFVWAEVERAALELTKGETADHLIESQAGFHIIRLEDKQTDGKNPKFSFRHILIQKKFEEPGEAIPGVPPPFMSAEEIARSEIEKIKRRQFVNEIIEKNPVSLPEDFIVPQPETKSE